MRSKSIRSNSWGHAAWFVDRQCSKPKKKDFFLRGGPQFVVILSLMCENVPSSRDECQSVIPEKWVCWANRKPHTWQTGRRMSQISRLVLCHQFLWRLRIFDVTQAVEGSALIVLVSVICSRRHSTETVIFNSTLITMYTTSNNITISFCILPT